ncbi:MAG: ankyrin repeat domain-containing protein [Phycisphaerales bacterium]|nr:MAG: ankyrin repeat domain-containing protein [Phycisphaerales bacterium]
MSLVRHISLAAIMLAFAAGLCLAGDDLDLHTAAGAGDLARMDTLLRQSPDLVHARDALGFTPLDVAARNLRVKAAELLIEAGADVNAKDRHGTTALHVVLAVHRKEKGLQTHRKALVSLLIKSGADVKATDGRGKTPLHIVAMTGQDPLLELLHKAGTDLAAKDHLGRTPLHYAAMYDHPTVIDWFLAHGVDSSVKDKQQNTPLHCAVMRFRRQAARHLIDGGAGVNALNDQGATPLHLTGSHGPQESEVDHLMAGVAGVLLDGGAKVNALDREGLTPLHHALAKERTQLADVLRRNGARE